MTENITRITDDKIRELRHVDRDLQERRREIMNGVADLVFENGGYCDEPTFLQSFYGEVGCSTSLYGQKSSILNPTVLPELVKERLKIAEDLEFGRGEVFARFTHTEGLSSTTLIGLILGSGIDEDSPVVEYVVRKRGSRYVGTIAMNTLVIVDRGDYNKDLKPEMSTMDLLQISRYDFSYVPELSERSPIVSTAVGLRAIRRSIADDPHYIYDGMVRKIDQQIEGLRLHAGAEALLSTEI